MSYSVEKVKDMITTLDQCFNGLEMHIFDMLERHPKTPSHIKRLLEDLLRHVARTSIKAEVILDEVEIERNIQELRGKQ